MKGFLSIRLKIEFPHLRVMMPTAQYMLAMKVMAIVNRYYDPSQILPRSHYLVDKNYRGDAQSMTPRPASLREISERASDSDAFSFELRDFLHEFARVGSYEMLREEPEELRARFPDGMLADAYLAAVADQLAARRKRWPPDWAMKPERYLREPWFATPGAHMRAGLLLESPAAFRERNLFVTANALSVA